MADVKTVIVMIAMENIVSLFEGWRSQLQDVCNSRRARCDENSRSSAEKLRRSTQTSHYNVSLLFSSHLMSLLTPSSICTQIVIASTFCDFYRPLEQASLVFRVISFHFISQSSTQEQHKIQ